MLQRTPGERELPFDQHIFISYAVLDDRPIPPSEQGWITRFHGSLEALLSMRLGAKARVWRDQKQLAGDHVLSDEIAMQISRTAILVSIISPRYLKSDWCAREMKEFCRRAGATGGVVFQNRSRVVKVLKTPIATLDVLPEPVRDILGYEFFAYEDDGTPLELDPSYGPEYAQEYHRKVGKLAWELSESINALGEKGRADGPDKATVYLAQTSYDRKKEREIMEGVLRHHGHTVLPDQPLPTSESEYVDRAKEYLAQCDLSIHLIGSSYGLVPDGPSLKSETMLQNEIAAELSKSEGLARIIWLTNETLESANPETPQGEFVAKLNHDREYQMGADMITGDIEALKLCVHGSLQKMLEAVSKDSAKESSSKHEHGKLIYLICIEKDRPATLLLRKYLLQQGYSVEIPAFEGTDAAQIRDTHRQLMSDCDGVLVFYGAGNESWKRTVTNELMKLPGYRETPLLAAYTYLSGPVTTDKEELVLLETPNLINGLEGFSESQLSAFLNEMDAQEKYES